MSKLTSRVGSVAAFCFLLTAAVAPAAPYYVAWGQLYKDDVLRSQRPHAVALDAKGNVFVTGQADPDSGSGQILYTAKYDGLDGHLLWEQFVTPSGNNQFIGNAIAVDSEGDCVVTGSRNVSGSIDYYTIKYNGATGAPFWSSAQTYQGDNQGLDEALKVVCASNGDVFVTGRSLGQTAAMNNRGFDWVTIKYRSSDGAQLAIDKYSGTQTNLDDVPGDLAIDSNDEVIVVGTAFTGSGQPRFHIRKLTNALALDWQLAAPIDTGDEGGATAVAIDANDAIIATGMFKDNSNRFGYYTVKYSSAGVLDWQTTTPPVSAVANGDPRPRPTGVAVGPDGNPIVTGRLLNSDNEFLIRTIKYTSAGNGTVASVVWDQIAGDQGDDFGSTSAADIVADGGSNAIIVGNSRNEDGNQDLYVAKYDALTGEKLFSISFDGSQTSSDDIGVGIAGDKFGNIAVLGDLVANKLNTGTGRREFATVKLNRFIAPAGEPLPNGIPGVADNAVVTVAGAPAISDGGALATKLSFKAGTKTSTAILVERTAGGGTLLPAVKGQAAPVGAGDTAGNWVSFSDPIIAPSGDYAFAAKVTGAANKANGVWANLNGALTRVFRQGSLIPVTGSSDKFASLVNMGLETDNLVALVKLVAPKSTNTAIIRVNQTGAGTVLLRTGQSVPNFIGTDSYTITGITLFTPAPPNGGDGRWQGSNGIVARVTAFKDSDIKAKVTAIVSISNTGTLDAYFFTGQTAATPLNANTYASLGFPATSFGTLRFTVKAGIAGLSTAKNSALVYSAAGTLFNAYARKGETTGIPGLATDITFANFTDPVVNTNSLVAFIATLQGPAQQVKASTNKMIVFGVPRNASGNPELSRYARTGDFAKDSAGNDTSARWTAFTSLALPGGGSNNGPIFLAKTSANKTGLWARDSNGDIRRLIMQGDKLGGQTVKKFTVLNTLSKVMTAPRSFDAAGSVAVAVTFTDNKTAILRIGIP